METTLPLVRRSAIEAASQCLFRYKALWVDGIEDMNDFAARGIGFHAAAHAYVLYLVAKKIPADYDESQQAFQEGISSIAIPGRLIPEIRELYDLWARNFALDLDHFLAAEELQETEGQVFTPDLVYARPHELEIRDFKTYFQPLTEGQARTDWQARMYVRNAMVKWPGFPSYRFTFDFVRFGTTVSLTFTPEELQALDRDVNAVLGMIATAAETGLWPATPGPACTYCTLACPVVDQPPILPIRLTPQQAPIVGEWILAAEQQLKAAKKALKGFCAANGPVDVQGIQFDNRPVEERRYPITAVLDELKMINAVGGFDAGTAEALTISHSALGKLFRQFPVLKDRLSTVVQAKTSYRFGAKKPGGDEDGGGDE